MSSRGKNKKAYLMIKCACCCHNNGKLKRTLPIMCPLFDDVCLSLLIRDTNEITCLKKFIQDIDKMECNRNTFDTDELPQRVPMDSVYIDKCFIDEMEKKYEAYKNNNNIPTKCEF